MELVEVLVLASLLELEVLVEPVEVLLFPGVEQPARVALARTAAITEAATFDFFIVFLL